MIARDKNGRLKHCQIRSGKIYHLRGYHILL